MLLSMLAIFGMLMSDPEEQYDHRWQQCAPCPADPTTGIEPPPCVAVETECAGSYAGIGCIHEKAASAWYKKMREDKKLNIKCEATDGGKVRRGQPGAAVCGAGNLCDTFAY